MLKDTFSYGIPVFLTRLSLSLSPCSISNDVLFSKQSNHSGPVRGLHFNPFQQNLLSSASSNGEVNKPFQPNPISEKEDSNGGFDFIWS